jgi:VIT1/CCC1 family predicted Fe2+/Mn2+ transporter
MDIQLQNKLLAYQADEITTYHLYMRLARLYKNEENRKVLEHIANAEIRHYEMFKQYTGKNVRQKRFKVWFFVFCARLLGLTFSLKLMEADEALSANDYSKVKDIPNMMAISKEEDEHEQMLIAMINEDGLNYMGSVILGLNDALVEFTGALAGFTLALNEPKLIALTGSITGIAAALSMGSSEYLSTKSEETQGKNPPKAAIYTSLAYLITVIVLVSPFVFCSNLFLDLGLMLFFALIIIALFNFYYAVVKGKNFKKRFVEMAVLSFSVAGISFLIGYLLKTLTGIDA